MLVWFSVPLSKYILAKVSIHVLWVCGFNEAKHNFSTICQKRGIEGPFFTVGFAATTLVLHFIATLPHLQVEKHNSINNLDSSAGNTTGLRPYCVLLDGLEQVTRSCLGKSLGVVVFGRLVRQFGKKIKLYVLYCLMLLVQLHDFFFIFRGSEMPGCRILKVNLKKYKTIQIW